MVTQRARPVGSELQECFHKSTQIRKFCFLSPLHRSLSLSLSGQASDAPDRKQKPTPSNILHIHVSPWPPGLLLGHFLRSAPPRPPPYDRGWLGFLCPSPPPSPYRHHHSRSSCSCSSNIRDCVCDIVPNCLSMRRQGPLPGAVHCPTTPAPTPTPSGSRPVLRMCPRM